MALSMADMAGSAVCFLVRASSSCCSRCLRRASRFFCSWAFSAASSAFSFCRIASPANQLSTLYRLPASCMEDRT